MLMGLLLGIWLAIPSADFGDADQRGSSTAAKYLRNERKTWIPRITVNFNLAVTRLGFANIDRDKGQ